MICPNHSTSVFYCNCKEGDDCALNELLRKNKYGYRKKPVVIEAFEYKGTESIDELVSWVVSGGKSWDDNFVYITSAHTHDLFIKTLEGQMHASVGDYIIKGVQGEFYACKPDIFIQTYEKA